MAFTGTIYDEVIKNGFAKLISAQNFSGVTGVITTIPATYEIYLLSIDKMYFSELAATLYARISKDNGATFDTSYYWANLTVYANADKVFMRSTDYSTTTLYLNPNNTQGHALSGMIKIYSSWASQIEHITWQIHSWGQYPFQNFGNGFVPAYGSKSTMFAISPDAGTITGRICLYGMNSLGL